MQKIDPTFIGRVVSGQIQYRNHAKVMDYLLSLNGKEIVVTIKKRFFQRSLKANNLYWKYLQIITEAGDGMATKERIEALHEYLKRQLLKPVEERVSLPNGKDIVFRRPRSTTELDSLEFSVYLKDIELLTAIPIPHL